jgi:plasmid stabilization system protein ParE
VEPASGARPAERPVDLIETLRRRMQEEAPAGKPGRPARPVTAQTPRRRAANERPTDGRRPAMSPKAWSRKDERQYEHIKESAKERGRSTDRAEEIAARTVNKQRREEGRTRSGRKTTSGTGNPNRSLEERSKQELYNRAKELDIGGRSQMSKQELVRAIRRRA